jgi:hypothetical protein
MEMAVVRRLQAALAPAFRPRDRAPPDKDVVDMLDALVRDERVLYLMNDAEPNRYTDYIERVSHVVSRRRHGDTDRRIVDTLWRFVSDRKFNETLASTDPAENIELLILRAEQLYLRMATDRLHRAR